MSRELNSTPSTGDSRMHRRVVIWIYYTYTKKRKKEIDTQTKG